MLWFLIPFLPYLVPMLLGFAWLPVGDIAEHLNGSSYPYGYSGRRPSISPTPDPKTSSQYNIPYFIQLRRFLSKRELPLWNPDAGLGMPMAAMGEGSPYAPKSILRALLPPRFQDVVSVAGFAVASFFFLLFLMEIGVERDFALLATAFFSLQGAFTHTILLANIAQSISMFPVVFWACARTVNRPGWKTFLLFVLTLVLFIVSGHIQHVFIGFMALAVFASAYCLLTDRPGRAGLPALARTAAAMTAALALTAPFWIPVYRYMKTGYHHHPAGMGLMSVTLMTVNYIFDPMQFGGFRGSIRYGGAYLFKANENLLYFGLLFFFFAVLSITGFRRRGRNNTGVLICFATGVVLFLKFLGAPVVRWLGYLPFFLTWDSSITRGSSRSCSYRPRRWASAVH